MLTNAVCQICTDVYDVDKPVAAMPCGHTFHNECLERWLQTTRNCPSCRKPLRKNQNPINRLFFSIDNNLSQLSGSSPKSSDPVVLEKNRKLQAQVTALQAAINKLKSECEQAQDEKLALSCALSDKDNEIQGMSRLQDKLKRRVREYNARQDELVEVKAQLHHLRHVQTIVEGVEAEVTRMLEEKGGYTPQQLTYVVLLRQQLDNSKRSNEKLKRDVADCRERLLISQRNCSAGVSEIELLKLELKQAESRNISLKKKCEMLIKSMNSPRGVASSLANRIVNQSPLPDFVTPPPLPGSTNHNRGGTRINTSTPAASNHGNSDNGVSPDLFDGCSTLELNDFTDDDVKQVLDFHDEDQPKCKRPKHVNSKELLTRDKNSAGDESPSHPNLGIMIKPKSAIKIKSKSGVMAINPVGNQDSRVRDVTNLPIPNSASNGGAKPSQYFRQGFDGMGGQAHSFSRTQTAMKFNVFKKPAVKNRPLATVADPALPTYPSINDFIVVD